MAGQKTEKPFEFDPFVKDMNERAREGVYDRPEALDELRAKASAGDLDAKAMLVMHEGLELNKRFRT
ncbi:MAG: hypothetical protein WDZ93_02750 [Candidatus Paceibacterota bacterium]